MKKLNFGAIASTNSGKKLKRRYFALCYDGDNELKKLWKKLQASKMKKLPIMVWLCIFLMYLSLRRS